MKTILSLMVFLFVALSSDSYAITRVKCNMHPTSYDSFSGRLFSGSKRSRSFVYELNKLINDCGEDFRYCLNEEGFLGTWTMAQSPALSYIMSKIYSSTDTKNEVFSDYDILIFLRDLKRTPDFERSLCVNGRFGSIQRTSGHLIHYFAKERSCDERYSHLKREYSQFPLIGSLVRQVGYMRPRLMSAIRREVKKGYASDDLKRIKNLEEALEISAIERTGRRPSRQEIMNQLLLIASGINGNKERFRMVMGIALTGILIPPRRIYTLFQYAIRNGADINCRDHIYGWTPLMYAVYEGDMRRVKALLRNGADKNLSATWSSGVESRRGFSFRDQSQYNPERIANYYAERYSQPETESLRVARRYRKIEKLIREHGQH